MTESDASLSNLDDDPTLAAWPVLVTPKLKLRYLPQSRLFEYDTYDRFEPQISHGLVVVLVKSPIYYDLFSDSVCGLSSDHHFEECYYY